jgi:uncharacterized membrane protein (UPF0127 family)
VHYAPPYYFVLAFYNMLIHRLTLRPRALRSEHSAYQSFIKHALASVSALFLLIGMMSPAQAQSRPSAQTGLPISELTTGIHVIRAEVANTESTRRMGLMHRKSLPTNAGMLFVFESPETQCFWMRNTPLPLSIAFIADNGSIVNIADMAPFSDDTHCSAAAVRYALEMEQGWFASRGVIAGQHITGLPQ